MAGNMAGKEPDPIRITTATRGRNADIDARQRRYLLSMAIRTLCFLGAIVVGDGWLRWVLVAAALFLPYVAVVMANAGASPDPGAPEPFGHDHSRNSIEPPPES